MPRVTWDNWNVGSTTSNGVCTAHPFRGFSPSGKVRKGEMYGMVFPDSDAAHNAMAERGYLQEYRRGPSYFILLRLPRRVKRHIAENASRRVEIIRAVLNEHDRAHWDAIRKIYGAARHDIELRNSAHLRKPKRPLVCA